MENLMSTLNKETKVKDWRIKIFSFFFEKRVLGPCQASKTEIFLRKCGAFRDLVPFTQFKKCGKYLWMSVNFSKVADASQIVNITLNLEIFLPKVSPQILDKVLHVPIVVVSEMIQGFHKTIWGTTKSLKIKFLLRRSRLRRDNKRSVIMKKSWYFYSFKSFRHHNTY